MTDAPELDEFRKLCEDLIDPKMGVAPAVANFTISMNDNTRELVTVRWETWLRQAELFFNRFKNP